MIFTSAGTTAAGREFASYAGTRDELIGAGVVPRGLFPLDATEARGPATEHHPAFFLRKAPSGPVWWVTLIF